jgi:hypothetical protein
VVAAGGGTVADVVDAAVCVVAGAVVLPMDGMRDGS